jgi:hypothetical protein
MSLTYDKYGHCVLCHRNLLIEQVIDQKLQVRFSPDYSQSEFLLDDGSRMKVAICRDCQADLTEHDQPKIMKSVIDGWQVEVDSLNHWTEEKRKNYMKKYSKLEIVCNSEGKKPDVISKKIKEHKEKKKWQ